MKRSVSSEGKPDKQQLKVTQRIINHLSGLKLPDGQSLDSTVLGQVELVMTSCVLKGANVEEIELLSGLNGPLGSAELLLKIRSAAIKNGCENVAKMLEAPIMSFLDSHSCQLDRVSVYPREVK